MNISSQQSRLALGTTPAHSFIHSFISPALIVVSIIVEFSAHGQISRPAAYLEFTIPPLSSSAIAMPFDPFSTNVYQAIEEQLGDDAFLLRWNASEQAYEPAIDGSMSVSAGDAFWIINESEASKRIFLSGSITYVKKTITVIPQLNLIGNPSVSVISNGMFVLDGDEILDARTPELTSDRLPIGRGMWYSRNQSGPGVVEFEPPLSGWPMQEDAPIIADISVNATGSVFVIVEGLPGMEVELYGQDVSLDGSLKESGWKWLAYGMVGDDGLYVIEDLGLAAGGDASSLRCYMASVSGTDVNSELNQSSGSTDTDGSSTVVTYPTIGEGIFDGDSTSTVQDSTQQSGTNEFPVTVTTRARVIYVSELIGKDEFTGRKQVRSANDGPKKTVIAGLTEALGEDVVIVMDGVYAEAVRIKPEYGVVRIKGNVRIVDAPALIQPPTTINTTNRIESTIESGE